MKVLPIAATVNNPLLPKETYVIYLSNNCEDDTKYGGLIISIRIPHALPLACSSISPLLHITCTGQFLTELHSYTLDMPNNNLQKLVYILTLAVLMRLGN